jgi:pimeloyl-ACP methyl ester carboxylesterase
VIAYPFDANGIATRVLEAGQGDRTVVFVHGTGGRADRWSRNLDAVAAAGFHCFAMDLPGHGFAAKGTGVACSVPAYRAFLEGFLDAAGIRCCTIVGTSLGGHVVASFAVENPARIDGIVLVGSMGLVPIGDEARARVQAGANNQTREGVSGKLQRVIFDPALVTPEMREEEYRVNNSKGAAESFAALGNYVAADLDRDVVGERLAACDFPILLVWGEQDKTVPLAAAERARAMLPRSRLARLAQAAHTAYYERADDFNQLLLGFLAGDGRQHQAAGVSWS